jgi:hypothetical protein
VDISEVVVIEGSQSVLPKHQLPALLQTTTVENEKLAQGLKTFLHDLDHTLGDSIGALKNVEVTEMELTLTVSAEGRVSLVVGAAVGAAASLRVTVKPRLR